jgi:hypothetical protein
MASRTSSSGVMSSCAAASLTLSRTWPGSAMYSEPYLHFAPLRAIFHANAKVTTLHRPYGRFPSSRNCPGFCSTQPQGSNLSGVFLFKQEILSSGDPRFVEPPHPGRRAAQDQNHDDRTAGMIQHAGLKVRCLT